MAKMIFRILKITHQILQYLSNKNNNNLRFIYYLISRLKFKKYIIGSKISHIYFKNYSKEKI
jgi:type I restriction enzyme S subunit